MATPLLEIKPNNTGIRQRPFLLSVLLCLLVAVEASANNTRKTAAATAAAFVPPPDRRDPPSMQRAPSVKRTFGIAAASLPKMSSSSSPPAASDSGDAPRPPPPLSSFRASFSNSWLAQLSHESPANLERSLARMGSQHPGRPVFNGHYVLVRPTPLANPRLVLHNPEVAASLGMSEEDAASDAFVKYFSGDVDGAFGDDDGTGKEIATWATPYALSSESFQSSVGIPAHFLHS